MIIVQRGGGSHTRPSIIGHRLTLVSGDALPYMDQTAKGTLYCTPYLDDLVSLYTGTAWRAVILPEISLALSGLTSGANYDIFLDYNDGTPQLVLAIWAGHGQMITALTNATPMVATLTAHPFQDGDQVYLESTKYTTLNEQADPIAPNGTWIVANRAANTFELAGSVGAGVWSRGGWVQGRLAANLLTTQNGVLVRTGDAQQRYVGTLRTTGTTTTEDSRSKRFLWNYSNQEERTLIKSDYEDHTVQNVAVNPSRVWQETGVNSTRVEWVQGHVGRPIKLRHKWFSFGAATGHLACSPGIDGITRDEFVRSSQQNTDVNDFKIGTLMCETQVAPGYHFADIMEAEVLNVQVTVGQGMTQGTVWA